MSSRGEKEYYQSGRRGATPVGGRDTVGGIINGLGQLPVFRMITKRVRSHPLSMRDILKFNGKPSKEPFSPSKRPSSAPHSNTFQSDESMKNVIKHDVAELRDASSPRKGKTLSTLKIDRRSEMTERVNTSISPKKDSPRKFRVPPGGHTSVDLC